MKRRYLNTVFIGVCLLLSACGAKVEIKDGGLLSEQTACKAPCLLGITPGVTRESEVWKILDSYKLSTACEVWDHTYESGTRGIQCTWNRELLTIGLRSQDDPIASIGFAPREPISISQVIEKYGEPSWVAIWDEGTPEYVEIGMAVFYDEIATRLGFSSQEGWVYNVSPETRIVSVSYLGSQEYSDYINSIKNSLRGWKGYGNYE
ncbi:MAG TPA: hypothetical protein VIQ51_07560 [Chryseosolibacter sp.]